MSKSFDVNALEKQIARLFEAYTSLDGDESNNIDHLRSIARHLKLCSTVQNRDAIAVAGMQGTGKTTLIRNMYNIDDGILRISNERGEKIPVFITEKESFAEGQYSAIRWYVDDYGNYQKEDLDVDRLARFSARTDDTIYIELFVARKFFTHDNSSFVILPGFEKKDIDHFDDEYNRLMRVCLNFSRSLLLVVDDSNMANADIDTILAIARNSGFDGTNSIFAITKCDSSTNPNFAQEVKLNLNGILEEKNFTVSEYQIICCSDNFDKAKNEKWVGQIDLAIQSNPRFNFVEKNREYYRPIIDEIVSIVKELEMSFTDAYNQINIRDFQSPIHDELQEQYREFRAQMEQDLDRQAEVAISNIHKNIANSFASIDTKYLKERGFFGVKKSLKKRIENEEYVEARINDCFLDDNDNNIYYSCIANDFVEKGLYISDSIYEELPEPQASGVMTVQERETALALKEKKNQEAMLIKSFFSEDMIQPEGEADTVAIAKLITNELTTYYLSTLVVGEYKPDIKFPNITKIAKDLEKNMSDVNKLKKKTTTASIVPVLDIIDGKPDILKAISSSTVVQTLAKPLTALLATPAGPYIAAAVAVAAVASSVGILANNKNVDLRVSNIEAAKNACSNAVYKQRDEILAMYDSAFNKMLQEINRVHREKNHIGSKQRSLNNAKIALEEIKFICQDSYNQYAKYLESGNE